MGETTLEQKLGKKLAKAVIEFNMIQQGDRILVAVSGGKDSYVMLRLLQRMQRISPVSFELLACHLDQGHPGFPVKQVEAQIAQTGVEYEIVYQDTYSIVKEKLKPGKTTCSLCSRLRRGVLYTFAQKMGCNKIALGHHKDDLIHTLMLNLMFSGQIKTMAPYLVSDDGRNTVIRPLSHCDEALIAEYAETQGFKPVPCTLCTKQDGLKRQTVKGLVERLNEEFPGVKESLFASLGNVRLTHLLDKRVLDKGAAPWGGMLPKSSRTSTGKRNV